LLAGLAENGERGIEIIALHGNDHANAAIEGAPHFIAFDVASLGQPVEDGALLPRGCIDFCAEAVCISFNSGFTYMRVGRTSTSIAGSPSISASGSISSTLRISE
jgi:hypothetical protein